AGEAKARVPAAPRQLPSFPLRSRAPGLGRPRSGRLRARRDPGVDLLLEHRQRHRPEREDGVVEGAQVELRSEYLLRARAQFDDADLAELVTQRLAGPGDVAVDLGLDLVLAERGLRSEVVDRLLPGPALVMHAGVDHQPRGAPHLVGFAPEHLVGRLVDAHFLAELLAVQRPSFAIRRDVVVAA